MIDEPDERGEPGEPGPEAPSLPPVRRGPPPLPPELQPKAPAGPPPGARSGGGDRFARADEATQSILRVGSVALGFGYGVIGCALIGAGIDWLAGTFPLWLLVLSGLGVIGGGYRFVKEALALVRTPGRETDRPR